MTNKILTLLGFASKAGRLSFGFDKTLQAIKKGKCLIALCAEDLSEKTKKEIIFHCSKQSISVFTLKGVDADILAKAVGRSCGVVCVNDEGFANALKEEILNDQ